jgi:hypothetical protein
MVKRVTFLLALAGVPALAIAWSRARAEPAGPDAGPVIDHSSLAAFHDLDPARLAAARDLRVLFIDHSVGENINQGLNCYAAASVAAAPNFCKRFEHVEPALSADPAWFSFGPQYDRARWVYQVGGSSYWREWPAYVDGLLQAQPDWDVVIMMPSYLVGPNGGWEPYEALEAAYPDITFVHATSSLPRGVQSGTAAELRMQQFNAEARAYALAHDKPFLDVADLLSHDYQGGACFDTRDGKQYCSRPGTCENLPDDGQDIPAICQHYTSELYGGHLGSVSGGMLRMAQAMWLLMARLAEEQGVPPEPTPTRAVATPTGSVATPSATPADPTAVPPTFTAAPSTSTVGATLSRPPSATPTTPAPPMRLWLPYLESWLAAGLPSASPTGAPATSPTTSPVTSPTSGVPPATSRPSRRMCWGWISHRG